MRVPGSRQGQGRRPPWGGRHGQPYHLSCGETEAQGGPKERALAHVFFQQVIIEDLLGAEVLIMLC